MLESTPCLLNGIWCLYIDQSWDCAGGDWQIITGDGEPVAPMYSWDGQLYRGGEIAGIQHFAWDDPEVNDFKASLTLTYKDILDIWCQLRVDANGQFRTRSRPIEWN